jgi:hypothetical protein
VLLLYGLCAVAAVFSLFQSMAVNHYAAGVIMVFCGIAWIGIQNLGYAEFSQARRLILAGGFRESLNSSLALRAFDESLGEAKTREERWAVLEEALRKFGLAEVRWQSDGKMHRQALWKVNSDAGWSLRIPLGGGDYINFTRIANMDDRSVNVGALVEILRKHLSVQPEQVRGDAVGLATAVGSEGR